MLFDVPFMSPGGIIFIKTLLHEINSVKLTNEGGMCFCLGKGPNQNSKNYLRASKS